MRRLKLGIQGADITLTVLPINSDRRKYPFIILWAMPDSDGPFAGGEGLLTVLAFHHPVRTTTRHGYVIPSFVHLDAGQLGRSAWIVFLKASVQHRLNLLARRRLRVEKRNS